MGSRALVVKEIPKHPISPLIEFLGYDTIEGSLYYFKITTIKIDYSVTKEVLNTPNVVGVLQLKPEYETAINAEPIQKYASEEDAIKGHILWVTKAWNYSKGLRDGSIKDFSDETITEDTRVLGRSQGRIR